MSQWAVGGAVVVALGGQRPFSQENVCMPNGLSNHHQMGRRTRSLAGEGHESHLDWVDDVKGGGSEGQICVDTHKL